MTGTMIHRFGYRIKEKIHIYRFLLRFSWLYIASMIGFVAGIFAAIIEPPILIIGFVLTLISSLFGVVQFASDIRDMNRRSSRFYAIDVNPSILRSLKPSDTYKDYRFVNLKEHRALYSPSLNKLIAATSLEFKMEKEEFRLSPEAMKIAPFAILRKSGEGRIIFNDAKVRLKTDPMIKTFESNEQVMLQPTHYFATLCTNDITCKEIWERETKVKMYDGLSFMSNNGILLDLQQSKCSNHLGGSVLAFTRDGFLVILVQSKESAMSPNLLAPSGSGSFDFRDFEHNPRNFIIDALERELTEECGLVSDIKKGKKIHIRTRLIGFARDMDRGGKPEFFGVSCMDIPFESLKIAKDEAVFASDIDGIRNRVSNTEELMEDLARYIRRNRNKMSFPLYLNLTFLIDFLRTYPLLFADMTGK